MKDAATYERYQRQLSLKELGEKGQQKLLDAKVLVIGAGGLGCPALQYLAAAGIGTIGIVDDDTIALHNLHRQPLFSSHEIGLNKAQVAAAKLKALNPGIATIVFNERLQVRNAARIIKSFDIILDATDNFATRYLVNDASVLLNKPLVYGAVSKFEGQVAVFNFNFPGQVFEPVNHRDLFPEPPVEGQVLNCAETGVLGVVTGIIGTMMANETIKLVTGIGKPLINRLLTYNALNNQTYEVEISPQPGTRAMMPASEEALLSTEYNQLCEPAAAINEIEPVEFDALLSSGNIDVIDVRDHDELPEVNEFTHRKIPLAQIGSNSGGFQQPTIVVFCQTGRRSRDAAVLLHGVFGGTKKIFSLKGGIRKWKQQHNLPVS